MLANVGLYSYLAPGLTFGGLALTLLLTWRGRTLGGWLIAACGLTALWGFTIAVGTMMEYPPVVPMQLAELARNGAWLLFLVKLTELRFGSTKAAFWTRRYLIGMALAVCILFLSPELLRGSTWGGQLTRDAGFATWLVMAITGVLLLEQLFRNASEGELWSLKYLCFGLGLVFGYDFFMYTEALLFRTLDPELWQARGFISALATPLIAISISRNRESQFRLQMSRQVVFHSLTLLGAGLYLIVMAVVGYFIRLLDATWGGVLQVSFLVATGALLLAVLFSGKIRAQLRVQLSKHFFTYRYDYREEWLKFTNTLASIGDDAAEGIVRAMAPLVTSPGGLLWARREDGECRLLANWQCPAPDGSNDLGELPAWLQASGWVIDLAEWHRAPDLYQGLSLPDWLTRFDDGWLIIPLMFGEDLQAVLLLRRAELKHTINWEDRDLLKTAGRQAATHLAQHLAQEDLVEARQFEAFNRLSAYVIHDLKNILAQQSLMLSNARRHRDNPEFIDDMISTVDNSVTRMTKLMEQMRSGIRGSDAPQVELGELLREVLDSRSGEQPRPELEAADGAVVVEANRERLHTVFSHLVKNAQEATDKSGSVRLRLFNEAGRALIEIEDSGTGMEPEFIRRRLFKPFDSTKGLTGMGIGAFESREFIRGLGGDVQVESTPGSGSLFRVLIPCSESTACKQEAMDKV